MTIYTVGRELGLMDTASYMVVWEEGMLSNSMLGEELKITDTAGATQLTFNKVGWELRDTTNYMVVIGEMKTNNRLGEGMIRDKAEVTKLTGNKEVGGKGSYIMAKYIMAKAVFYSNYRLMVGEGEVGVKSKFVNKVTKLEKMEFGGYGCQA